MKRVLIVIACIAGGCNSRGGSGGTGEGGASGGGAGAGGADASGGRGGVIGTAGTGGSASGGRGGVTGTAGTGGSAAGAGGAGAAGTGGGGRGGSSAGAGGRGGAGGMAGGGGGGGGAGRGGSLGADAGADARRSTLGDPCWSPADCRLGGEILLTCQAPGQFLGCGALILGGSNCTADGACRADGGTMICEVAPPQRCYLTSPKICQSSCSATGCAAGQICDVDGRCRAKPCTAGDQSCPTDFVCDGTGHCARKSCTTNSECSADCVNGGCYGMSGGCASIPA